MDTAAYFYWTWQVNKFSIGGRKVIQRFWDPHSEGNMILFACKATVDNKRRGGRAIKTIVVMESENIAHLSSLEACPGLSRP